MSQYAQIEPQNLARTFEVRAATRTPANLLIGLIGPSGSGKTYSALRLASGIREVSGGDIVLIDTENRRARHYADAFKFRHVDFSPPFGSFDYLDALTAAMKKNPGVVIIDSLTHEHEGEGGLLDFYSSELIRLAGEDPAPNQRLQMAAWRRPKQARRSLIAGLLRLETHVICCFRAAERTRAPREEPSADPIDLGFTPIAGPEFIYEMTLSALLRPGARGRPTWASDRPGEASAIKLPAQFEAMFANPEEPLCERQGAALAAWARATNQSAAPRSVRDRRRRQRLQSDGLADEAVLQRGAS